MKVSQSLLWQRMVIIGKNSLKEKYQYLQTLKDFKVCYALDYFLPVPWKIYILISGSSLHCLAAH